MQPATLERSVDILRCPVSRQPLGFLGADELAATNQRLAAGAVVHRDGTPARTPLTRALGTADRAQLYRVEDDIAWLLPDLALVPVAAAQASSVAAEKKIVQSFYDEFGWVKANDGHFNDTAQFTDVRPLTKDYQRYCNGRIAAQLSGGRFLLDVASGAIPHPEYLDFSRNYDVRVCVDFSIRALREARAKLGEKGLYLLGDITRLPLADDAIDTAISLHTIYHVPRPEQTTAVDELVRVTKRGGRALVVYNWATSAAMNFAFALRRELGRVRHAIRPPQSAPAVAGASGPAIPPLYFSPQDHDWFQRDIAARHGARLRVWSGVSVMFQHRFFADGGMGRWTLALTKWGEDTFPRLAGRYGQYPMFVIDKPAR